MSGSINQPWAISEKFVQRYGTTWANTDFVMNEIYESHFKTEPMDLTVGTLHVGNTKIPVKYKHLISESNRLSQLVKGMYMSNPSKDQKFYLEILQNEFVLCKHEIAKISETMEFALDVIQRKYQIGLYL
tara:strand:+ start:553 stop:942 length:390 start_codon:yes stop_codon:yes gene_type:complete